MLMVKEDDDADGGWYVRSCYGVPARVGTRVVVDGVAGAIAGFNGQYLLVTLDGSLGVHVYHPTWRVLYSPSPLPLQVRPGPSLLACVVAGAVDQVAGDPDRSAGQAYFAALAALDPDAASAVTGTVADPFYNDDALPAFLAWLGSASRRSAPRWVPCLVPEGERE